MKNYTRVIIIVTSVACVLIGGYILINKNQNSIPNIFSLSESEGKDESSVSHSDLQNHNVKADEPRLLVIKSINVKSRVLSMGVKSNNQLKSPNNIYDTAWYNGSSKPGQVGAVLIDGHVSGPTKPGVFKRLNTLKSADMITIENGAKKKFDYMVKKVETTPVSDVNMVKAMQPYGDSEQGLNLITCGGTFSKSSQQYSHRTIVYATALR